jgi:hypothetical protein
MVSNWIFHLFTLLVKFYYFYFYSSTTTNLIQHHTLSNINIGMQIDLMKIQIIQIK